MTRQDRVRRTVLAVAALALATTTRLHSAPPFKPVPASRCTLPVDSTIVLEFPLGQPQQKIELASDPTNLPSVDTSAQNATSRKMTSRFESISQSGKFGAHTIHSELAPGVNNRGEVDNVVQSSPGVFQSGRHTHNLFLEYTIDKGTASEKKFRNRNPIKIVGNMSATAPTGAVYTMTNGPIDLVDVSTTPPSRVARLHALENRVQRP